MSNVIVITKGKILGRDTKTEKIEIAYTRKVKDAIEPSTGSEELKVKCHPDLKTSIDALRVHAALLGEFIAEVMVPDIENVNEDLIKDFTVTGFTIVTDKNENESVILTASKKLRTGKVMGFNTPAEMLLIKENDGYPFMEELIEALENSQAEFLAYYNGEKLGTAKQTSLELDEQR